ncbi:mannose-1-phosphate guanylyltransferase [Sphingomonas xanthus]|uniref:Mannose-1-phosphate guanyltransferase n=1 Tax=Sphingomonas xanthus TaxID=2594473 RepID=A0A516ISM4_9SPHN|nr:sugar phosphate nucleotidyltransferase [Sphingomonas xanthus]QDP19918.1 mannose-1-phosphate guanyltransferase [Sphingomonas xanthus]
MSETAAGRPIRPVILAGGAGTRLWPLSTASRPKHLLPLVGDASLFEQTLARFGEGFAPPVIVANRAQEAELRPLLPVGARLILEPVKRDSAAAIALAVVASHDAELLLIVPSDHHIADSAAFHQAIGLARAGAEAGRIVTFGVEPTYAATGFGYIAAPGSGAVRPVAAFVEKPPLDRAEAMIAAGGHYWNAGIFLASRQVWREELECHAPAILSAARAALESGDSVDETAFARSPSLSIDYAVMEHSPLVSVVPVSMGWSDVGSWAAVFDASAKDRDGNVSVGEVLAIDSPRNMIRSDGPRIVAIGVEDLAIVASGDSVLVMRLSEAQRVRDAADWAASRDG